MGSHVFHQIYLHLNWHTKHNERLLQGDAELLTHSLLRGRAGWMKGVRLIEVGGTDDHVHLVIQIAPFVTIRDMVSELKGGSAHDVNQMRRQRALEWQRGYGVVSFGQRNLEWVVDYVRNQRRHHATGQVFERLETHDSIGQECASPAEAGSSNQ